MAELKVVSMCFSEETVEWVAHGGQLGPGARPSRGRAAFSLIELLVVLAIVSILIGLLLPALSSARRAGRQATCRSNLHGLVIANTTYAVEHEGLLAPGASDFLANLDRWHGRRRSVTEPFEPHDGPLSEYLGPDGAVRRCPELRINDPQPGVEFEAGSGGYGYNNAYLGVGINRDDRAGVPISRIMAPQRTIMFGDAALALKRPTLRVIEYGFAEPPRHRNNPQWLLDPSLHFRHSAQAEVAWCDGHVIGRRLSHTRGNIYGVTSEEMRALGIGWFGPTDNSLFDLE